jgi:glycosyltransferase involved in cell wall biosynthesis
MPYNVACLNELATSDVNIYVVFWDNRKLTPYNPFGQLNNKIKLLNRSKFNFKEVKKYFNEIKIDLIFTSGWMDIEYLKSCYYFRKRGVKILCGFDTIWNSNLKSKVKNIFKKYIFQVLYTHAFVPGYSQYFYARKLGFKHTSILTGAYTANTKLFYQNADYPLSNPKTILFIGRLEMIKGVDILVDEFIKIVDNDNLLSDWKLILAGNGSLKKTINLHPNLIIKDFVGQSELLSLAQRSSFFVLPSRSEPWGLVVHEMACMGLPLLLSNKVGASEDFLVNGYNGYQFDSGDKIQLQYFLLKLMKMDWSEIKMFGKNSLLLSKKNNVEIWCSKIKSLL